MSCFRLSLMEILWPGWPPPWQIHSVLAQLWVSQTEHLHCSYVRTPWQLLSSSLWKLISFISIFSHIGVHLFWFSFHQSVFCQCPYWHHLSFYLQPLWSVRDLQCRQLDASALCKPMFVFSCSSLCVLFLSNSLCVWFQLSSLIPWSLLLLYFVSFSPS